VTFKRGDASRLQCARRAPILAAQAPMAADNADLRDNVENVEIVDGSAASPELARHFPAIRARGGNGVVS
jgi:hypothetical protein